MQKTLYQILNVNEAASDIELHGAFKKLEQDLLEDDDEAAINQLYRAREAFLTLSDPGKRLAYDRKLSKIRIASRPQMYYASSWTASLLQPTTLLSILAICGLIIYWNLETQKIRLAEATQLASQQIELEKAKQTGIQEESARQQQLALASQQADLEEKRLAEHRLLLQHLAENNQAIAERTVDIQATGNDQRFAIQEQQTGLAIRRQEQELAERQMEMNARQASLNMQLKQQAAQNATLTKQRAIQQLDVNIQSIRDYQAAKVRAYDRNNYGTGGITISNPAYEDYPDLRVTRLYR